MALSFVPEDEKDRIPLNTMHIGWGVQVVVALLFVLRRRRQLRRQREKDLEQVGARRLLIKQQTLMRVANASPEPRGIASTIEGSLEVVVKTVWLSPFCYSEL